MSKRTTEGVTSLRLLAAVAGATGKEIGTPAQLHPDAELLELCAQALDLRADHDAIDREARKLPRPDITDPTFRQEMDKRNARANACKSVLSKIGKIPSRTGAGVYAKAMVLRDGYGTAPALALSLAEDLVACPGLRVAIWPATAEGK